VRWEVASVNPQAAEFLFVPCSIQVKRCCLHAQGGCIDGSLDRGVGMVRASVPNSRGAHDANQAAPWSPILGSASYSRKKKGLAR